MSTCHLPNRSHGLAPSHLQALQHAGTNYAWANSLMFKQHAGAAPHDGPIHAPFCLLPSPFPRLEFEKAVRVQTAYNRLYLNIASSPTLIREVLGPSISKVDPFVGQLYRLWGNLEDEVAKNQDEHLSLGIFRSDYLLHQSGPTDPLEIKQVEFNTVSVSFGSLATKISGLHRYLGGLTNAFDRSELPESGNQTLQSLSQALKMAHQHYLSKESPILPVVIVMVVKPAEKNIFDQSLIEYQLASDINPIRVIRLSCHQILQLTSVDPITNKLFYSDNLTKVEVSVVYYRCMYGPEDFLSDDDWNGRYQLERSRAINCPNLSIQLAGCKKFQQMMTDPKFLETHREILKSGIDQSEWEEVQSTWASIYSLDDPDGYRIASDPHQAVDFVLKPQREGGGNNIYQLEIPKFIQGLSLTERESYILMGLIKTPKQVYNYLIRPTPATTSSTNQDDGSIITPTEIISELGIFGFCFSRRKKKTSHSNQIQDNHEVLFNFQSGHLLRTKNAESGEGGVAIGISCLDSPLLV